jgi:hypothetical protein
VAGVRIRSSGMKIFMDTDIRAFGNRLQRSVINQIRFRAPGRIRFSLRGSRLSIRGYQMRFRVSADTGFSLYPDQGTGIYVGKGYIYPVRAQAMVFRPKGSAKLIFARRIKGQPPQHFMRNGLVAAIRSL